MKSGPSSEVPHSERQDLRATDDRPVASPEVDIFEGPNELLLIADLPGVPKDGVAVSLSGTELTIEGKRSSWREPEGEVIALDSSGADFRRTFVLPREVDPDGIRAEIDLGVLRVHLPKAEAPKPTSIRIKAR